MDSDQQSTGSKGSVLDLEDIFNEPVEGPDDVLSALVKESDIEHFLQSLGAGDPSKCLEPGERCLRCGVADALAKCFEGNNLCHAVFYRRTKDEFPRDYERCMATIIGAKDIASTTKAPCFVTASHRKFFGDQDQ